MTAGSAAVLTILVFSAAAAVRKIIKDRKNKSSRCFGCPFEKECKNPRE